ncbi:MAG: hypothetical protein H6905_11315 [Hyphomicrobiales bacterium]|nr:hypothetical protein [Hyphomicrobiales bacterium]
MQGLPQVYLINHAVRRYGKYLTELDGYVFSITLFPDWQVSCSELAVRCDKDVWRRAATEVSQAMDRGVWPGGSMINQAQ